MMYHAFLLYEMQALVAAADRRLREVPAAPAAGGVQPRRGHAAGAGPSPVAQTPRSSRRRCRRSTSDIRIRRRSTASIGTGVSGRTARGAAPSITCYGRPGRCGRISSILVAGCGTSQAAKVALRWPRARVTGIDFSATSVRHTEALKREYKLDNLTFASSRLPRWRRWARRSIRSSARASCITLPTPTPG